MNHHYNDIRRLIDEEPEWFDECAVPRYCTRAPSLCANIYADEVAFVEIRCQNCGHKFIVAFSWGMSDEVRGHQALSVIVEDGGDLHYGDPPNIQCCPAGPTMTSISIRVVEFWKQNVWPHWRRIPGLEIEFEE